MNEFHLQIIVGCEYCYGFAYEKGDTISACGYEMRGRASVKLEGEQLFCTTLYTHSLGCMVKCACDQLQWFHLGI